MRHRNLTAKLGRKDAHRDALISNIVTSLLRNGRVVTTLRIARLAKRYSDRMVTLAKKNTLHARRQAISFLRPSGESAKDVVKLLFAEIGPRYAQRLGGYTRVLKVAPRRGDAAPMAVMELVGAELKTKARKQQTKEDDVQVETELAPGTTIAAVKDEKPQAEPKPEKPKVEKPKAEPKPEKPKKADAAKTEKPAAKPDEKHDEPKDRKGGFGRFFKKLLGSEGEEKK